MDFRIGCNVLTPGRGNTRPSPEEIKHGLRWIKESGYTHVEYSHVVHLSDDEAKRVRDYTREMGLKPWSIHSEHLNDNSSSAIEEYLAKQRKCIRTASILKANVVVVHLSQDHGKEYDLTKPEIYRMRFQMDKKNFAEMAELAADNNLMFAIENSAVKTSLEIPYMKKLLKILNMSNVGLNIDTGHAALGDMMVADVILSMGKDIITTHLQDNLGRGDDHMPPGMGCINWIEVFSALKKVHYTNPYMVEVTENAPTGREVHPEEEVRLGAINLKKFLTCPA